MDSPVSRPPRPALFFHNTAAAALAKEISEQMQVPLGVQELTTFADGELNLRIDSSVTGQPVCIVASTSPPAENILATLMLIDTLHKSGASHITLCIPYLGYARQDNQGNPGHAAGAELVFSLLSKNVNAVYVLDPHHEPSLEFFAPATVISLSAASLFASALRLRLAAQEYVIISPDRGSTERARHLATLLQQDSFTVGVKVRLAHNQVTSVTIDDTCKGKTVVLIDDMIDTGGTIVKAAEAAYVAGAKEIIAVASHGLFSNDAIARIDASPISHLMITDSLATADEKLQVCKQTTTEVISIASVFAEALK